MTTQGYLLYKLQEIELQILKHQKRLGDIATELANNASIQQAQRAVDTASQAVTPLNTKATDLNLQLQSVRSKRDATEKRLYSGAVKNPKELTDMQNEIATLQKRDAELDELLLEAMLYLEEAQGTLAKATQALKDVTTQVESEQHTLLAEKTRLEAQVKTLQAQRQEALKPISATALQTYNALRPQKANQPMALLQGQTCGVCGIEQNSIIAQAVRKGEDLTHCKNCRRILVVLV
jgi:predicted  nucleic acid-binding Zn-ribbon protein